MKSYKIEMKKKVRNPLISIDFNVTKPERNIFVRIVPVSSLEIVCFGSKWKKDIGRILPYQNMVYTRNHFIKNILWI